MTTDTLERPLPQIHEDLIDAQPAAGTDVAATEATSIDLEKVNIAQLAVATLGNWREKVKKLKADNASTVLDLSTQTKVDEAISLRNRTINVPKAAANKTTKYVKSALAEASRKLGAENDALQLGYDEAAAPLTTQIDDAQKRIDDAKEAARKAEEERLAGLRTTVDQIMQKWVDRATAADITAERIGAGVAALRLVEMPVECADVTAHWTQAKASTCATLERLQREAAIREEDARLAAERAQIAKERWELLHSQMDAARDVAVGRAGAAAAQSVHDAFITDFGVIAEWKEHALGQAYVQAMNLLQPEPVAQKPEAVEQLSTAGTPAPEAGAAAATVSADREGGEPRAEPEAAPNFEGRDSQHVVKAEAERPDATDREKPVTASPRVGAMGVGQPADAGPTGDHEAAGTVQNFAQAQLNHEDTPIETSEREAVTPRVVLITEPAEDDLHVAARALLAVIAEPKNSRFPSQPKVGKEWFEALYAAAARLEQVL